MQSVTVFIPSISNVGSLNINLFAIAIHKDSSGPADGSLGVSVRRAGRPAANHHQEFAVARQLQQHAVVGTVARRHDRRHPRQWHVRFPAKGTPALCIHWDRWGVATPYAGCTCSRSGSSTSHQTSASRTSGNQATTPGRLCFACADTDVGHGHVGTGEVSSSVTILFKVR